LVYTDNSLTNVFDPTGSLPQGQRVYTFAGGLFSTKTKTGAGITGWGANATTQLPNGSGYFANNVTAGPQTITYVGEVAQGNLTNALPTGLSLKGNQPPVAGFIKDLGITSFDGDRVYRFGSNQLFITYTRNSGSWPVINNSDAVKGPFIRVGEGFFYNNATGAATWTQNFTVPQ